MTTGRQAYRTVHITVRDIIAAQSALANLAQAKPKNMRLKLALAKVQRAAADEIGQNSAYADAIKTLAEECAKRDANGNFALTPDGRDIEIVPAKLKYYRTQVRELENAPVELRVPSILTDEMADLGFELSVGDVSALTWLFEEQEYELPATQTATPTSN